MQFRLPLLLSVLLITACSKKAEDFHPDVYSNSRGGVVTNKDNYPYENVEFAMMGHNFKTLYTYKVARIDTGQRVGLRWQEFKDIYGRSIPRIVRPESVTIKTTDSKGIEREKLFPINN